MMMQPLKRALTILSCILVLDFVFHLHVYVMRNYKSCQNINFTIVNFAVLQNFPLYCF